MRANTHVHAADTITTGQRDFPFMSFNIAFVAPRYNAGSAGGAEVLCQHIAEHAAKLGMQVTALTTCVQNNYTWQNHFPEGTHTHNGVTVRRFKVRTNRNTGEHARIETAINAKKPVSLEDQKTWLREGVFSPGLLECIKAEKDNFDAFIFVPYLFGTSYFGVLEVADKAVLIPCLHDEPFAYLEVFKQMFDAAKGVLFNAYPEQLLAQRLYSTPEGKAAVVGMGIDEQPDVNAQRFCEKFNINDPFIFYAGRREGGKNTPLLIEYFRIMKKNTASKLKLVLAGSGKIHVTDDPDVIDIGFVSEQEKHDAMAAATVFCQPSNNESFSIVIMEAWLAGTPALVSADCAVTRHHCELGQGGLYFSGYYEFEECVRALEQNQQLNQALAQNGAAYIRSTYSWDSIIDKFQKALQKFGIQQCSK